MYSLDNRSYKKSFTTIGQLIDDIIETGTDPNDEITKDGVGTGETAWDHMVP